MNELHSKTVINISFLKDKVTNQDTYVQGAKVYPLLNVLHRDVMHLRAEINISQQWPWFQEVCSKYTNKTAAERRFYF